MAWNDIIGDPLTARLVFRAVMDNDFPANAVLEFDGFATGGAQELPVGPDGDQGPQGEYGAPLLWKGDVASAAALPDDLAAEHEGWWYSCPTEGWVRVWNGATFLEGDLGAAGPDGPPVGIAIGEVEDSPPDGQASLTLRGTAPNQLLDVVMPTGKQGPPGVAGPASPLQNATNFFGTPAAGSVVEWNAVDARWEPKPQKAPKVWSLNHGSPSDFDYTSSSGASKVIASMTIPTQSWSYRVEAHGGLLITGPTASKYRLEVLVDGIVVASGMREFHASPSQATLRDFLGVKVDPTSSYAVFSGASTHTVQVRIVRTSGTSTYNAASDADNFVLIRILPV